MIPTVVGNQPLEVSSSLSLFLLLLPRPALSPSWIRSNDTASITPHAAAAARPLRRSDRGFEKNRYGRAPRPEQAAIAALRAKTVKSDGRREERSGGGGDTAEEESASSSVVPSE